MQPFPISSINDLERISYSSKWQYFEKLVAFIFDQNGFDVNQNVVVKTINGKRQFDVIAEKYGVTYMIECKKWKSKTQKTSSLKSAAMKHIERCESYELSANASGRKFIPFIVTLLEDEIEEHENVPIVPIMKLNWFLNNEI